MYTLRSPTAEDIRVDAELEQGSSARFHERRARASRPLGITTTICKRPGRCGRRAARGRGRTTPRPSRVTAGASETRGGADFVTVSLVFARFRGTVYRNVITIYTYIYINTYLYNMCIADARTHTDIMRNVRYCVRVDHGRYSPQ